MLDDLFYTTQKLGKDGKPFTYRKIRTMVKDASNLRSRLIRERGVDGLGKINGDPRIIPGRRFLREYGIDELPQLWNLLRGEMALVGVRPRTEEEWGEMPLWYRRKVLRHKPGWVPPLYYYDNPEAEGGEMIINAEYLYRKETASFMTDLRYLFRAIYNIVFRGVRSR